MSKAPNKFLQQGLPLLVLTMGGWLGLSYFMKGRLDVQDAHRQDVDLRAPVEKQRAKRFNIEEELAKLKGEGDDYVNKPIERPKEWWDAAPLPEQPSK